jgi:hypothetical protein
MPVAALKLKPKLKMFHATVHVTRVEESDASRPRPRKRHASCWSPVPVIACTSAIA